MQELFDHFVISPGQSLITVGGEVVDTEGIHHDKDDVRSALIGLDKRVLYAGRRCRHIA